MSDERRICVAIHGWWGAGKSWLADTTPGPRLIMDAEGGVEDTPSDKVLWNPQTEDLPTGLGEDDSVVVDVTSWDDMDQVMKLLVSGDHPFESVVVDSLTEIQKQLKDRLSAGPDALFDQQAWGKLLNNMEYLVRKLRDQTRPSANKRVNVVIITGTDEEQMPKVPMFQGGLRKSYAGFFDIVGYLTTARDADGNFERRLQLQPDGIAVAKCRLHKVAIANPNGFMPNPSIPEMLEITNG